MKFLPILSRSVKIYSCQYRYIGTSGSIFNQDSGGTKGGDNASFESADDFERRIFGGISNDSPSADSFYHKLDRFEKSRRNFGNGFRQSGDSKYKFVDDGGDSFNTTLSDGLDGKLKKAATSFFYEEMRNDDYAFRPDVSFKPGMTYDVKNVRFLANFITEAGIIIKRSKTKISAKAQRKIAREIKTSRAFGLMPFTTMGTKRFVLGKTMEDTPDDFLFDHYKFGKLPSEPDIEPLFQKHDEGGDAV